MIEIINKKPLSEIKEEKEMEKIEAQADIFVVVANLYEEFEAMKSEMRSEIEELKNKVEILEGGAK